MTDVRLQVNRYERNLEAWGDRLGQMHVTKGTWRSLLTPPWRWRESPDWSLTNFFELYCEDTSAKTIFQLARHTGFGREKNFKHPQELTNITGAQTAKLVEQVLSGALLSVIVATSTNWLEQEYLRLGFYILDGADINLLDEYGIQRMPERLLLARKCFDLCSDRNMNHLFSFSSEGAQLYSIKLEACCSSSMK